MTKINWWKSNIGFEEINRVVKSIENKKISQGSVTLNFEKNIANYLGVKHAICVTNGTSALLLALMALDIKSGDEVIIPNRAWISPGHAARLINAKVVLANIQKNLPLIDVNDLEKKITKKTKVIIPVHLNGRSCDMDSILKLAKKYNVKVIEDAAQAFGSKNLRGYLGTQSDIGCFSLSIPKIITTGQGGFVVTNNNRIAEKMKLIRTHSILNVNNFEKWNYLGFNFRYTDIQASIGIEQLKIINKRKKSLIDIYKKYRDKLVNKNFKLIPVDVDNGEIPIYAEFLVNNRNNVIHYLQNKNIETRPFYPNLNKAKYLYDSNQILKDDNLYSKKGLFLPSGPDQTIKDINRTINLINKTKFF